MRACETVRRDGETGAPAGRSGVFDLLALQRGQVLLQSFEEATGSLARQETHSQQLPETQECSARMEITTTGVSGGQPRRGTMKAMKKRQDEVGPSDFPLKNFRFPFNFLG